MKAVLPLIPAAPHQPGSAPNQPPASQLPHDVILHRLNALPEDERRRALPQVEQALKQRGLKFYTEDEWRNSEHYRDMPFEPFMTVERAKAKAEIFDANRAREWLIAHRPDGVVSGTLGFLANTVGGLADPTTLAGLGVGGKLVMNLGRTGVANLLKGAGIGAADGGLSSLAHDYSLRQSQAKWGEQHSDGEIWENAGWAALIGGGLGGGFQGARMLRAKPGEPAGGGGGGRGRPATSVEETQFSHATSLRTPADERRLAGTPKLSRAEQLKLNKQKGDAFEGVVQMEFAQIQNLDIGTQLTIITESGERPRLDIVTRDNSTHAYDLIDAKSSETAPLTRVQKVAYPEIEKSGGTIVGKGKLGFPGGTVIPPTKVKIRRPKGGKDDVS